MTTLASRPSRRSSTVAVGRLTLVDQIARNEGLRARRYPISRWYLRPVAGRLAHALAPTRVRPVHLTACGLLAGMAAAAILYVRPDMAPISGVLILAWWFFDRTDGQLARLQGTVSAWGAWFDANADELVDVTIHVAMASAAVASATAASATVSGQAASPVAWGLLAAFLFGKHLFVHGLWTEEHPADGSGTRAATCGRSGRIGIPVHGDLAKTREKHLQAADGISLEQKATKVTKKETKSRASRKFNRAKEMARDGKQTIGRSSSLPSLSSVQSSSAFREWSRIDWLRALYHLPGNADVRVHLLAAALLTGWLTAELAVVAVYYNVRWTARYVLVARREGGGL